MKTFARWLLLLLLLGVIVAAVVGFLFFRTWATDASARVVRAEWQSEKVSIGDEATLEVVLEAPWHRSVASAEPSRYPESLRPHKGAGTLRRGACSIRGIRTWHLSVPMVAVGLDSVEGQSLSIPLEPSRRISSTSVTVAIPALPVKALSVADGLDEQPRQLSRKPTEAIAAKEVVEDGHGRLWLFGLLPLVAVLLTLLVWKRISNRPETPPWLLAQAELDSLAGEGGLAPPVFYSRLTDILKSYVAARFGTPSDAETSSELIESIAAVSGRDDTPEEFVRLVGTADGVKFAGAGADGAQFDKNLDLVRHFVDQTTPKEEPS